MTADVSVIVNVVVQLICGILNNPKQIGPLTSRLDGQWVETEFFCNVEQPDPNEPEWLVLSVKIQTIVLPCHLLKADCDVHLENDQITCIAIRLSLPITLWRGRVGPQQREYRCVATDKEDWHISERLTLEDKRLQYN